MNIFQALDALTIDGKRIARKDREHKDVYIEMRTIPAFCLESRPYTINLCWTTPWLMTIEDCRYEDWEIVK